MLLLALVQKARRILMENSVERILSKRLLTESEVLERQLQIYTLYTKINGTNTCVYLGANWRKYFL